jgi:hypothetical protein
MNNRARTLKHILRILCVAGAVLTGVAIKTQHPVVIGSLLALSLLLVVTLIAYLGSRKELGERHIGTSKDENTN